MNTQYWEEELETMSREKLQELQLRRLKKTINIAANSPYYKEVFSKHGITADSIQSLDDIRKLPFTTKADMRAHYPFGLVAGDMSNDGVRIHSSSGTTGNPTVIVHSQHDLDSWANLVAPLPVRSRNTQDRRLPKQLRIRYVYRRIRLPIRCRTPGLSDSPCRSRKQ